MGCGGGKQQPKTAADVCYAAFTDKKQIDLVVLKSKIDDAPSGDLGEVKITSQSRYTPLQCVALNTYCGDSAKGAVASLCEAGDSVLAVPKGSNADFAETPMGLALEYENQEAFSAMLSAVPKDRWEEVAKGIMAKHKCQTREDANQILSAAKAAGCPNEVVQNVFMAKGKGLFDTIGHSNQANVAKDANFVKEAKEISEASGGLFDFNLDEGQSTDPSKPHHHAHTKNPAPHLRTIKSGIQMKNNTQSFGKDSFKEEEEEEDNQN